jgi:hypothetical protein
MKSLDAQALTLDIIFNSSANDPLRSTNYLGDIVAD